MVLTTKQGSFPSRSFWLEAALLTAAVAITYLPSVNNGFVYDDMVLIVDRPAPTGFSDFLSSFTERHHPSGLPYYRPLATLTLTAQKALWGDAPMAYHLFNVILLLAAALSLRALFRTFTDGNGVSAMVPSAFAAVFVLHPMTSSTVFAISGRETLMVTIFMAASLRFFVRPGRLGPILASAFFAAALMSKEQAVVMPVLFLLADLLGLTTSNEGTEGTLKPLTRLVFRAVPYLPVLVVAAIYLIVRGHVLFGGEQGTTSDIVLAVLDDPFRPVLSALYFVQSSFTPFYDLHYEPHMEAWASVPRAIVSCLSAIALGVAGFIYCPGKRKLLLFWAGWSLVTLLPSANIVAQETLFAERYGVLPLVGLTGLAATIAGELANRTSARILLAAGTAAALIALSSTSYHRGRFFEDDFTFLTQWAASDPTSYQANASLAEYHLKKGDYEEALGPKRESLRLLHQQLPEPLCIKGHFGLASILVRTGRYDEAIAQYEEILRMKPHYTGARRSLDRVRRMAQQADESQAAVTADGDLHAASRQRLVSLLGDRNLTGSPIWLTSTSTDVRSQRLRGELEAVFREAGWDVRGSDTVDFGIKPGLYVFVASDRIPDHVNGMYRALEESGMPMRTLATGYREYASDMTAKRPGWKGFDLEPEQEYVLVVGRPK